MLGEIASLLAPFVLSKAKNIFEKRAFKALLKKGLLPEGAKFGTKGANSLLSRLAEKGFNAEEAAAKGFSRATFIGGKGAAAINRDPGMFGFGSLAREAITPSQFFKARNVISETLNKASALARTGRAYGAASNILFGYGAVQFGWGLLSNANRFFEKEIPPPALEIMQTQQAFLPRQAYTQRQRAIQAIHQSAMTTRSAIGNEAMYMH